MMGKKSYISIFSSCGGLSLGFKNSGKWAGLFANVTPLLFAKALAMKLNVLL